MAGVSCRTQSASSSKDDWIVMEETPLGLRWIATSIWVWPNRMSASVRSAMPGMREISGRETSLSTAVRLVRRGEQTSPCVSIRAASVAG